MSRRHAPATESRRLAGPLPSLASLRARLLADQSGESLLTFAATIGVLMLFMLGMIQMCLAYYSYATISDLAREGTRWAIVRGDTCVTSSGGSCMATTSSIESYVRTLRFPNVGGGTLGIHASLPGNSVCAAGSQDIGCPVQVTVTYSFPWKIPFLPSRNLALSSTSVMSYVQ